MTDDQIVAAIQQLLESVEPSKRFQLLMRAMLEKKRVIKCEDVRFPTHYGKFW